MGPPTNIGGRADDEAPQAQAPQAASMGPPTNIGGRSTRSAGSGSSTTRFNGAADEHRRKGHHDQWVWICS